MSKLTSQELAAKIETVEAQLATLHVQYNQAVLFESAVAEGNSVRFYSGRADEDGIRPTKVGVIVGVGVGGNGNRLVKVRVGTGFDEETFTVRVTEVVEQVQIEEAAPAQDAAV